MKKLICLVALMVGFSASQCNAGIAITISPVAGNANNVEISWSGSGTVDTASGVGNDFDFLNFGNIFREKIKVGTEDKVNAQVTDSTLILTKTKDFTDSTAEPTSFSVNSIIIEGNSSDGDIRIGFPFTSGSFGNDFGDNDEYAVSGSATISNISILDFEVGSYTAANIGDADNLSGAITLRVTGVPEPSSLTLFAIAIGGCLLGPRRRRAV